MPKSLCCGTNPLARSHMSSQYKARIERLEELAEKSAGLMAEEEAAARRSDYRLAGDLKDQSEEMRRTLQDLLAEPI